jgi:hypothetical protein
MKRNEKTMQLHYNVDYELNGETLTEKNIWSSCPGSAMAHVLKKNPEAKIIKAWKEGNPFTQSAQRGYQEWAAPPVQRVPKPEPKPARALKPKERGCEFPFYDEVVGQKQ